MNNMSEEKHHEIVDRDSPVPSSPPLRVAILHLDLGIGGAEQLIVNIAKQLQASGHSVDLFTSHHNINHCFEETKPDGILGRVIHVYGDFLPRHLFGKRFTALCATIRMIFLALCFLIFHHFLWTKKKVGVTSKPYHYDVVIVDGVSTPLVLLKYIGHCKILFYCHFPDKLLCTEGRGHWLKRIYRYLLDALEMHTTSLADMIVVNSCFTASVCRDTWPEMFATKTTPDGKERSLQVLYPVVEISSKSTNSPHAQRPHYAPSAVYGEVFVSLNRYERKKKIETALDAMALLVANRKRTKKNETEGKEQNDNDDMKRVLLVIAGGYDPRVAENREYLEELQAKCCKLQLTFRHDTRPFQYDAETDTVAEEIEDFVDVVFRTSISSQEREALFLSSTALLYTPDKEHFGIVPLEAMGVGLPVIAVASGGPLESVRHNRSGFLTVVQSGKAFAEYMHHLIDRKSSSIVHESDGWQQMEAEDYVQAQTISMIETINAQETKRSREELSRYAIEHVKRRFSAEVMRQELNELVYTLHSQETQ